MVCNDYKNQLSHLTEPPDLSQPIEVVSQKDYWNNRASKPTELVNQQN